MRSRVPWMLIRLTSYMFKSPKTSGGSSYQEFQPFDRALMTSPKRPCKPCKWVAKSPKLLFEWGSQWMMAWSPLIIRTVSPGRMIRASWLREFLHVLLFKTPCLGGQEEVETIQVLDWVLSCPSSFCTPQLHLFDSAKFSSWSDANDSWPSFHMVIRDRQLLSSSESWSSTWSKRFSSQRSFWKELQALISKQKFHYRAFLVMIFPALNKQDLWQGIQDIPPVSKKMGPLRCIHGFSTWFNPKWLHLTGSKTKEKVPRIILRTSLRRHLRCTKRRWKTAVAHITFLKALPLLGHLARMETFWFHHFVFSTWITPPTLNQTCSLVDCAFPHIISWLRLARPKWRSSYHCYVSCLNRWSLKTSWWA